MKQIIVAIDGYSSCGKSTIAKQLAQYAGYRYIDTGAMYRAVALYGIQKSDVRSQISEIIAMLPEIHVDFAIQADGSQHVTLNGEDVEKQIRTLEVGNMASQVAVIPEVRRYLVAQQQKMGEAKGVVMDGRDIGTTVFPNAELKIFVTADVDVRAQRRYDEMLSKGEPADMEEVKQNLQERDRIDQSRAESPLRKADDAVVLDNSHINREEQLQVAYDWAMERIKS